MASDWSEREAHPVHAADGEHRQGKHRVQREVGEGVTCTDTTSDRISTESSQIMKIGGWDENLFIQNKIVFNFSSPFVFLAQKFRSLKTVCLIKGYFCLRHDEAA